MIKVVIVEDESITRKGIKETIDWQVMGCVIIGEAANGEQGISIISELKPDLVITDVRMPHMDGLTMLLKLQAQGCISKFIILTAHSDFPIIQQSIRAGVSDYLLKPIKEKELESAIQRIFGEKEIKSDDPIIPTVKLDIKEHYSNNYINGAIHYIKLHYAEDITMSHVSDYLGISEGYLSRLFKRETGYTFTNYLSYYRMNLACALLQNMRNKVYQVANEVGYEDTAYFSTLFKKIIGISPSEYQSQSH